MSVSIWIVIKFVSSRLPPFSLLFYLQLNVIYYGWGVSLYCMDLLFIGTLGFVSIS